MATAARQRSSATLDDYDVVDPIGQSSRVHRQAADQIAEAVEPIVVAISSALREAERV